MQSPLFNPSESSDSIRLLEKDGQAEYFSHFYKADESDHFFESLLHSLAWKADQINIFGKLVTTARKVAWVGDPQCRYTYSGIEKIPQGWTEELLQIKHQLEEVTGYTYNSCLLNLYHNGDEGMGWHSDNEKELDSTTPIASISLGARRKFAFRHKQDKTRVSVFLEHGSLLIMYAPVQDHWHHSLLKTKTVMSPRMNLTFRKILPRT